MRQYAKDKYNRLRARMIQILGGKCAKCGSTIDLEMDHVDPSQKQFSLSQLVFRTEATFLAEVAKCQLLCDECHKDKHRAKCGTLGGYRYCRCSNCKKAKSDWQKNYIRSVGRTVYAPDS